MSGNSETDSVDSMYDVTELLARVDETSIWGIALYVRVPVYQVSALHLQPEQPTTEELMVGYITVSVVTLNSGSSNYHKQGSHPNVGDGRNDRSRLV